MLVTCQDLFSNEVLKATLNSSTAGGLSSSSGTYLKAVIQTLVLLNEKFPLKVLKEHKKTSPLHPTSGNLRPSAADSSVMKFCVISPALRSFLHAISKPAFVHYKSKALFCSQRCAHLQHPKKSYYNQSTAQLCSAKPLKQQRPDRQPRSMQE